MKPFVLGKTVLLLQLILGSLPADCLTHRCGWEEAFLFSSWWWWALNWAETGVSRGLDLEQPVRRSSAGFPTTTAGSIVPHLPKA